MDLRAYLRAVRKSWWIVVLATVVGGVLAGVVAARATPVYQARIAFYVGTSVGTSSPDSNAQFAQDEATSLADVASGTEVAAQVGSAARLGLPAKVIAQKISGSAKLNTRLVDVSVSDTSPERALAIATALGKVFPAYVARLDSGASAVTLTPFSGPSVSLNPVSPRKTLDVALGLLVGLLVGLAIAVLREVLDTAVRSPEALAELAGRPLLGDISYDSGARKTPLFVDERQATRRSEEYRQLRTNLVFIDAADPVRVVVVTSALPAEGKSSTAANLAIVAVEADSRVLLIDADLRRGSLGDYLGIERYSGLTNVLSGQVEVDDVLQSWGKGLTVLAAGPVPPNPSELLGGRRMAALVEGLRDRYDLIIIDTPPLLPVTDAVVLTALADGVVLIARHGKTKRAQVSTALDILATAHARLLGVVLTMRPSRGLDSSGYNVYYRAADEAASAALTSADPTTRSRWSRPRLKRRHPPTPPARIEPTPTEPTPTDNQTPDQPHERIPATHLD